MTTWIFRALVTLMALFALAMKAHPAPCSILMTSDVPCSLQQGQESPYSGTLMTDTTAWDLTSRIYKVKELELDIGLEKRLHAIDNEVNEKIIYNLKVELEDVPLAFYESPWFWIGMSAAFAGGLYLGLSL